MTNSAPLNAMVMDVFNFSSLYNVVTNLPHLLGGESKHRYTKLPI